MIDHQTFVNLISAFTLLAFVAGAGFGLAGYTSARRAALRDYIAHGQRSVAAPTIEDFSVPTHG